MYSGAAMCSPNDNMMSGAEPDGRARAHAHLHFVDAVHTHVDLVEQVVDCTGDEASVVVVPQVAGHRERLPRSRLVRWGVQ
jgi:hypothetical protein